MYSSYDGAKRQAKRLNQTLKECYVRYPLGRCQLVIARAGGFRDWHELKNQIEHLAPQVSRSAFRARLLRHLPEPARLPAKFWLDDLPTDWEPGERLSHISKAWYEFICPYELAMTAVHRKHTALVRLGSGPGQRLRETIVLELTLHMGSVDRSPVLDAEHVSLVYTGSDRELFRPQTFAHPHFGREIGRLEEAGVLARNDKGDASLTLFPPSAAILIEHALQIRARPGRNAA